MRRVRIGLVAAMAAALALTAAPAQAGPGDPVACFQAPEEGNPGQNIVTVNGFDVTVTPGTLPGDADSARSYALAVADGTYGYAWCVQGDTYDALLCLASRGAYVDIYLDEPRVTFRGNQLVADLNDPCLSL